MGTGGEGGRAAGVGARGGKHEGELHMSSFLKTFDKLVV